MSKEYKPLRIQTDDNYRNVGHVGTPKEHRAWIAYSDMLSRLAIAESNLVRAGKDSALPHFNAIVKELERIHNFEFVKQNEDSIHRTSPE